MKRLVLMYMLLASALSTVAQERTISGKVTAVEDGTDLPGVNVLVKRHHYRCRD